MIKSQGKLTQIIHSKLENFGNELRSLSEDTFFIKKKVFCILNPAISTYENKCQKWVLKIRETDASQRNDTGDENC